ncbi:hypothetical protein FIA58_007630 [Flavobacterium jejuense]|uniref:Peptidase C39 domain-containing protein n=1 Tax=Flavobacterium jejuense TaxID=1544455 RepID=A0ABX0IP03_9FLAO|nr:cysteine peptidase family C39 domain-containing protein [Flavobacterium jejuense]NHN25544.1 hypothetical protein [Flavobacterium jejuense]
MVEESKRVVDEIIENTNKTTTGSGGFFKYNKILSRNMVAQEKNMSCAAACIKQLAKYDGIEISEELVRKFAGTDDFLGTTDLGIVSGLEEVFKNKQIIANTYFRNSEKQIPEIIRDISKDGSWIASIHPVGAKKHAIIIGKILGDKVYIRDPWPIEGIGNKNGIVAITSLEEFSKVWLRAGANKYSIKQ